MPAKFTCSACGATVSYQGADPPPTCLSPSGDPRDLLCETCSEMAAEMARVRAASGNPRPVSTCDVRQHLAVFGRPALGLNTRGRA